VLLLGVAVALYARNSTRGRGGLGGDNVGWVAAWVGALLGAGDRLGISL